MNDMYVLLGSNEGDRAALLQRAQQSIESHIGQVIQASSIYETASWGNESLPPHLNAVLLVQTLLTPQAALKRIHEIEHDLGRKRIERWGMRVIDIDILFYNHIIVQEAELTIPHPLMQERRFTLVPMAEIAADFVHPIFQVTMAALLDSCTDPLEVRLYND